MNSDRPTEIPRAILQDAGLTHGARFKYMCSSGFIYHSLFRCSMDRTTRGSLSAERSQRLPNESPKGSRAARFSDFGSFETEVVISRKANRWSTQETSPWFSIEMVLHTSVCLFCVCLIVSLSPGSADRHPDDPGIPYFVVCSLSEFLEAMQVTCTHPRTPIVTPQKRE